MRKLFKEGKLFKGGNYMRKYDMYKYSSRVFPVSVVKSAPLCNDWNKI